MPHSKWLSHEYSQKVLPTLVYTLDDRRGYGKDVWLSPPKPLAKTDLNYGNIDFPSFRNVAAGKQLFMYAKDLLRLP